MKNKVALSAVGMLLFLCACKSKPHAPSPEQNPNQVQAVNSPASESLDEKSCRVFVQKFYNWRESLLVDMFCAHSLKGTKASQEAIDEQEEQCEVASAFRNAEKLSLNQVLSPTLDHYLQREEAVQTKEEDAGLDFDPYLNTQDPSPKFVVDSVRVKGDVCGAVVHGYDQGKQQEEVMPELSKASGRWVIENFHYKYSSNDGKPPQDDDLIHIIRAYIGEVK